MHVDHGLSLYFTSGNAVADRVLDSKQRSRDLAILCLHGRSGFAKPKEELRGYFPASGQQLNATKSFNECTS